MTTITINGKPATGAHVSISALARRVHKNEMWVTSEFTKVDNSNVRMTDPIGLTAPADHPALGAMLTKAHLSQSLDLHTVTDGAKEMGHKSGALLQQAVLGSDALFYNKQLKPLYTISELESAMRGPARATNASVSLAMRAFKLSAPAAISATIVAVGALRIADQLGSRNDPASNINARRVGALAAAALVSTGGGLAVGQMARGIETRTAITRLITRTSVGAAIGGVAVGAVALLAMRASDQPSTTPVSGVAK